MRRGGNNDRSARRDAGKGGKNACKKHGEWQKLVIDFQAPRFEDGKKTANARFLKVTLNDEMIHENVEAPKPTGSELSSKEVEGGPLMRLEMCPLGWRADEGS